MSSILKRIRSFLGGRRGGASAFSVAAIGRATIAHTKILACPECQAPGLFSSEERIRAGWPGSYVPPGDPREGKPVGGQCPNCSAARGPELTIDQGVVWKGHL
nr:hypothetical protein [uncultured Rhodopila sp.]